MRSFGFAGQCASLSLSHYVVDEFDHRYQYTLDQVIHLLDGRMTAVRPNDGRKPE